MQLEWMSRPRERHLGHVCKGDRKPQVPPHTPENDIARIMTPFEGIRRGAGHVSPYQILVRFFATIPDMFVVRVALRPKTVVPLLMQNLRCKGTHWFGGSVASPRFRPTVLAKRCGDERFEVDRRPGRIDQLEDSPGPLTVAKRLPKIAEEEAPKFPGFPCNLWRHK
jgi:hypothetical protein